MFHDQHVFTHGMCLPFCFFMPSLELSMGIFGVGSFPVWSGGSLILGGSIESHLIPLPSLCDGEWSSFPGLVPSDDAVDSDSVMGFFQV